MKRTTRKLTAALSLFYLAVLVWIILFKMEFSPRMLDRARAINLVPFAQSTYPDGRLNRSELVNNVLIFVPLGLYLTMLWRKSPVWLRIGAAFCVSLLFELLQFVFAIGVSDITDLLGNTAGGAIGVAASALLYKGAKNEERVTCALTGILLIGSVCFAALAALLLAAN